MAHFAELNASNEVLRVIVVANDELIDDNGDEQESLGVTFCVNLFGGTWKQTSYTAIGGTGFRGNYAGIGFTYMSNVATMGVGSTDVFISPKPFTSWSVGVGTANWYAPISCPALTADQRSQNDADTHKWN